VGAVTSSRGWGLKRVRPTDRGPGLGQRCVLGPASRRAYGAVLFSWWSGGPDTADQVEIFPGRAFAVDNGVLSSDGWHSSTVLLLPSIY